MKVVVADMSGLPIKRTGNTILNIPLEFKGKSKDIISEISIQDVVLGGANGHPISYVSRTSLSDVNMIPSTFALHQNYPNPFNPKTQIQFDIPEQGYVELAIYNLMGQKIRTLTSMQLKAGYHDIVWDGTNDFGDKVASGMYFYTLGSGTSLLTKKMLYLK